MLSVKGRNRYYQCISISQAFSTLVTPILACDGKVDRFGQSDQASLYSRYRPQYSSKIIDSIASKVQNWDVYIDWACGSGQLTHKLAPKFNNTFGTSVRKKGPRLRGSFRSKLRRGGLRRGKGRVPGAGERRAGKRRRLGRRRGTRRRVRRRWRTVQSKQGP